MLRRRIPTPTAAIGVDPLVVGATMDHGGTHPPKESRVDLPAFAKFQYAGDSAHWGLAFEFDSTRWSPSIAR